MSEKHFKKPKSSRFPMNKETKRSNFKSNLTDEDPTQEEKKFPIRLNKFIAHAGLCSRRKAADLVKAGFVQVNGKEERNPAILIEEKDNVTYQGEKVEIKEQILYLLLNKPKGFITTSSDERDRKTVLDLLKGVEERIYPVGRLDRETTGLLLLTNDGDLAFKLSHPSHEIKKTYRVTLDKAVSEDDLQAIRKGLILEDGKADVDEISYVNGEKENIVGLSLHSGKNRIIRRIFEHLKYGVVKLDRIYYAGLTKKDLPRGRHRHLTKQEVIRLKHFKQL